MWVWSDELADRFPAMRPRRQRSLPLIAYAVEQESDLEALARAVLLGSLRRQDSHVHHRGVRPVAGR
jgi:hypothetical protein